MLHQSTSWPRRMPSHNSSVGFCSYKSSIWKSKGKKGAENRVAVHLLRMQVKNTRLMTTWEEKTRRSDSTSENTTFGMTTYLFKVCANACWRLPSSPPVNNVDARKRQLGGGSISWTTNKSASARNTAVAFYPGVYRGVIYISAGKAMSERIYRSVGELYLD